MPQPLSLDAVADQMRQQQANPTANTSSQTVWDPELGMFVQLGPGETPKNDQQPLNVLAKEPYFA
ncbi:MAG: hypothetical protein NC336_07230 [Clostridium sp.]|nr:hypothetical protein [Clostridium sp.]